MGKNYFIKTFGCQMNEHDSLKMAGLLAGLGYEETAVAEEADLVLFNTCTVRAKAHQKAFSEIGRVVLRKRQYPDKPFYIGVCGCVAQEEGSALLERFPEIDLVFGPDQIQRLPSLLEMVAETKRPAIATALVNSSEDYHFLDAANPLRVHGPCAFVTIMKGCNSNCSYCIVPKVRGREVHRPAREIVREAGFLAERGVKEVTLLGQNVNSYRDAEGVTFARLIRLVSENTPLKRIRFTSPHPKDCREDLIAEYAANPVLAPHIHLPLQSGSDAVLRRMRRAYNTGSFREKVEALRRVRSGIGITTDMIAGFPGETEEEFQATLDFLELIRFDGIFAFKYSPRPDTEAFQWADDVPEAVKEGRLAVLLEWQREISRQCYRALEGKTVEVLAESKDKRNRGLLSGRTACNKIANFPGHEGLIGDIVKMRVGKAFPHSLEGEITA